MIIMISFLVFVVIFFTVVHYVSSQKKIKYYTRYTVTLQIQSR